jgi:hypothetical protein
VWERQAAPGVFFLEKPIRFTFQLLRASTIRSEPGMAALAAIAIGMFVGTWVIGPAVTRDTADTLVPAAAQDRASFEDMVSRPDPLPYRSATPAFDTSGPPNYGAVARAKAQAELGGRVVDFEDRALEPRRESRSPLRDYRAFDRHRIY